MPFDPNSLTDLQALRDELAADPAGIGYTGDDATDADLLMEVIPGSSIDRPEIPTAEIRPVVVSGEWPTGGANASLRDLLIFHTQGDTIDPNNPNVRQAFLDAFPAGSVTRTNLAALQTREGSRLEELFGAGSRVTPSHVADARRS